MSARYGAALSEHPEGAVAIGEAAGELLEVVGPAPDLVLLFITASHAAALADMAAVVRTTLAPGLLLGVTAVSVLAGEREVEEQPGVALFAARLDAAPQAVRLEAVRTPDGLAVTGVPDEAADGERVLVLLADPFSIPVDSLVEGLAETHPLLRVVGGLASAARGPGQNGLVLDGTTFSDGAVGALLPVGAAVTTLVSQGCRPIGDPLIVTRAEGQLLHELAGQPALERLVGMLGALDDNDRVLAERGLHVGRVIDERKLLFERGDFLIRGVLGADRASGTVAVGDLIPVGSTVQFQVRDAASADEDLRHLLARARGEAALVFTCNGRGTHLFGEPDHDAALIAEAVGGAVAGMFCAGELGPVGPRSFLHGFTASVLLFGDS